MFRQTLLNRIGLSLFCMSIVQGMAFANDREPVLIGMDAELDACPSLAEISSTKSVALHARPSLESKPIIMLKPKQHVYLCDGSKPTPWIGVVVPLNDKVDCGVSSAIKKPTAYQGPCKSGWIKQSEFEVIAG